MTGQDLKHSPCFLLFSQSKAKLTEEHMRKEFESLHQFLRDEEAARLLAVRKNKEEKNRETKEQIEKIR